MQDSLVCEWKKNMKLRGNLTLLTLMFGMLALKWYVSCSRKYRIKVRVQNEKAQLVLTCS